MVASRDDMCCLRNPDTVQEAAVRLEVIAATHFLAH
jgi:hypothetical protein